MNPYDRNEPKVKVATRTDLMSGDAAMVSGLLLLVLVSVLVLIGRIVGGM